MLVQGGKVCGHPLLLIAQLVSELGWNHSPVSILSGPSVFLLECVLPFCGGVVGASGLKSVDHVHLRLGGGSVRVPDLGLQIRRAVGGLSPTVIKATNLRTANTAWVVDSVTFKGITSQKECKILARSLTS